MADQILTKAEAWELQAAAQRNRDLLIWTITRMPTDYPAHMVARPGSVRENCFYLAVLLAATLDELRAMLPPTLTRIDRSPDDDPVIVEIWL